MAHRENEDCPLISLDLSDLDIDILGLNVHIPCLKLFVTGDEAGGLLGSLLCGLLGPNNAPVLRALAEQVEKNSQ